MWSPEALSTVNALAARVGSREALRLFTSRLKVDTDRANAILAGPACVGCGDVAPAYTAEDEKSEAA